LFVIATPNPIELSVDVIPFWFTLDWNKSWLCH